MLEKSTLVWQGKFVICKKVIKILVINYQSEFALNLLSMLIDIKSFTCPGRSCRFLDSLLFVVMRERETLKMYSNRYWEMFNKIDGDFDDVTIRTFKVDLPTEHDLRKSLIGKLATSVCQLMDRIDKYKRVKEDQQQGKGKAKVVTQERRDFRSNR